MQNIEYKLAIFPAYVPVAPQRTSEYHLYKKEHNPRHILQLWPLNYRLYLCSRTNISIQRQHIRHTTALSIFVSRNFFQTWPVNRWPLTIRPLFSASASINIPAVNWPCTPIIAISTYINQKMSSRGEGRWYYEYRFFSAYAFENEEEQSIRQTHVLTTQSYFVKL